MDWAKLALSPATQLRVSSSITGVDMKKLREYDIHEKFLTEYENAALENAQQILDDAKILLKHKSFARAYFLAVASIEETGKAYFAFSCKNRNLTNDALKKKIKEIFENHSQKIGSAFIGWKARSSDQKESVKAALELIFHLGIGREKSMYVDANPDNSVSIPMRVLRPVAATDSVKVAENCLYHTKQYLSSNQPPQFTTYDDKFFCLKKDKINEMFKMEDFSKYLLAELEKAKLPFNFTKLVVTYHDKYFSKRIRFESKES